MQPRPNQVALITGPTAGIGYELAKIFAANGYDLVLVSRNKEKLHNIATDLKQRYGTHSFVFDQDLSNPHAPWELFREISGREIEIDVLVNNAGFGMYGKFADLALDRMIEMIQLNILSLTQLTKLILPGMLKRGRGKILNVSSTAAFQPGPLMAVYYATKSYVLSFSEAIANELSGTGVQVSVLCPGPTRTEFQKTSGMERIFLFELTMMSAEDVAKIAYRGLHAGKTLIIPGFVNWFFAMSAGWAPRKLVTAVVRFLQEKKRAT